MYDVYIDFGAKARVVIASHNKIVSVIGIEPGTEMLNTIYRSLSSLCIDNLTVCCRVQYISSFDSRYLLLNTLHTYEDRSLYGVVLIQDLTSLQELARMLNLSGFYFISNVEVYRKATGVGTIIIDEYCPGSYIIAPYANGTLIDYKIVTDIALEEIAGLYPAILKQDEFVSMLDSDKCLLELQARFINLDDLKDSVKHLSTVLLSTLCKDGIFVAINEKFPPSGPTLDLDSSKTEKPHIQEQPSRPENNRSFLDSFFSILLILTLVLGCVSFVLNRKVPEDLPLLQQASINSKADLVDALRHKDYLTKLINENSGVGIPYNVMYDKLTSIKTEAVLTLFSSKLSGYEMIFLVKSQQDGDALVQELNSQFPVEVSYIEEVSDGDVTLYKIMLTHNYTLK